MYENPRAPSLFRPTLIIHSSTSRNEPRTRKYDAHCQKYHALFSFQTMTTLILLLRGSFFKTWNETYHETLEIWTLLKFASCHGFKRRIKRKVYTVKPSEKMWELGVWAGQKM
jgi:hypothetical protein